MTYAEGNEQVMVLLDDPAILCSIQKSLAYLVSGPGMTRCPDAVYADAHYGLAMVNEALEECEGRNKTTSKTRGFEQHKPTCAIYKGLACNCGADS